MPSYSLPYGQPASSSNHLPPHPAATATQSNQQESGGGGGVGRGEQPPQPPTDGFFRFTIDGTTFRLMLISKDRQNLLKIYSYDFLMVGLHLGRNDNDAACTSLELGIWEYEWKRLEKHARKAVAPMLVFGYFRDVLRLDPNVMDETIEETRLEVKKVGRKRHAIPRFVDFVNGNSKELEAVFLDIRKVYSCIDLPIYKVVPLKMYSDSDFKNVLPE